MSMTVASNAAAHHHHNHNQQHSALCPQAYHQHPFAQSQQNPGSWPDHHYNSLASPITASKMDPHHHPHHHNQWPAQSGMRTQFPHYPTDPHQCAIHLPRPTEMPPTPASFAYVNPAAAHAHPTNMPSPPPSDGSPRPDWASYGTGAAMDADQNAIQVRYNRNSPILRPDGVRKKNAKFDIPEERNLDTLDELIRTAKDEVERKELKMQKRLLRNREAALHSRQKKKTHTDSLEQDNKKLATKCNQFQHTITALQIQVDDHVKERDTWTKKIANAEDRVRTIGLEKDAASKENARLTAELESLRAQLRPATVSPAATAATAPVAAAPQPAAPAGAPPPSSFADASVGMAGCGMDGPDWQAEPAGYDFMSDLYLEPGKGEARPDVVVH